jgi:hypothetical protein
LVKSQKIPATHILLLSACKILLIRLYEAISVEELFLKPYCSFSMLHWTKTVLTARNVVRTSFQ